MKQKTVSRITIFLMIVQVVIMILPYLGIHPSTIPTNIFSNIFNIFFMIVFFRIPLIWIIFLISLYFIFSKRYMQNKITSSGKVNNLNCNENLEETYELTQEHHWVLLTLLKQVDQSIERAILISMYNAKFKKTTSDFNILRDELLNKKLIGEIPTLGEGFRDATMWYLTPEGLKLAKEKYKSNTEKVG